MAILITTSAPIDGLPDVILPNDRTFSDMINEISDEIDDTTNEYSQQIQTAIFDAIRFCEREPFYFNESLTTTFLTVQGQYRYGIADNTKIATAAGIANVYLDQDSGIKFTLDKVDIQSVEVLFDDRKLHSVPIVYSYFGQELYFYPAPDREYKITLQLEPVRFDRIKNAGEVSPWFTEAYGLIRARTKYELYKNILKDMDMAASAYNDFKEEMAALKAETNRRNGTNRLLGTYF